MFTYLEDKQEIAYAQRMLERTIADMFVKRETRDIGFPGGNVIGATVRTDYEHWYRTADFREDDTSNPRRLNWFGIYKEDRRYYLQITVEINTAFEERNNRVAGFFGKDVKTGAVYLFHSGRVGGGKKGVGKEAFLAWSNRRPDMVLDSSDKLRPGVLVMPIEGPGAARSLKRYIDSIAAFKAAVRAGPLDNAEYLRNKKDLEDFYKEASGRRIGRRSSAIDYLSRHGDVVDAVFDWRSKQQIPKGAKIVKNVLIDMGVKRNGHLIEVFEVKTSTERSNVYSAIGQLMVHGVSTDCRRVVVLPHETVLASDIDAALRRLGIEMLRFKLDEKKATIVSDAQQQVPRGVAASRRRL